MTGQFKNVRAQVLGVEWVMRGVNLTSYVDLANGVRGIDWKVFG